MKVTNLNLLEQIHLTDIEMDNRLQYLNITDGDITNMQEIRPLIYKVTEEIATQFYDKMLVFDEAISVIGDSGTLSKLKKQIEYYVLTLFDGYYDREYILSRLRIGLVHKRLHVSPALYIMGVYNLKNIICRYLKVFAEEDINLYKRWLGSLEKFVLFDLTLVFDMYIHCLLNEVKLGAERLSEYARTLEAKIIERTSELKKIARLDGLTQLYNQRTFYEELRREHARMFRREESLGLIYMDLDNFKAMNDQKGHKEGDLVLVGVATVIKKSIRVEDIGCRYGGDEFCVLLPQTDASMAEKVAKRLVDIFNESMKESGISLSIGIAEASPRCPLSPESLVQEADKAMYEAKKEEGNIIRFAKVDVQ